MNLIENIQNSIIALKQADAILITAGAGMGVDSGLPDFRGNEGFWKAYPPIAKLGLSFSDMANPQWFKNDPTFAWAFYGHRLDLYRKTIPHKGFNELLEIVKSKPLGGFVYTSNVDGQFQKAGFFEKQIEECHGSIHHLQCTVPCKNEIWKANEIQLTINPDTFKVTSPLPVCPHCGKLARPNILMFGDWHWISDRTDEQSTKLNAWLQNISDKKLVIIEIGAGKSVPSVRMKSERITKIKNATFIRINPRDFEVPENAYFLKMNAAEGIHFLYENWKLL